MGHALSMDLRVRPLAAIEGGLSCRTAAVRLASHHPRRSGGIRSSARQAALLPSSKGETCVRAGPRSDLATFWPFGSTQGHPAGESARCLERGRLTVAVAGLHRFFARQGMRARKDWACHRKTARRPKAMSPLVRWSDRSGIGALGLHRRDLDRHQHDAQSWPLCQETHHQTARGASSAKLSNLPAHGMRQLLQLVRL